MKSNIRNEIKAQIIYTGYTMQEVVDLLHDEYGWSDSVSNLSGKLQRGSLRYREAVELADVLGVRYLLGPPQRQCLCGERRSSGASELSCLHGSEGCTACDDEAETEGLSMEKAQYAIMRFAKYKGPEIGNIEAHNERTKEKYASNPDVDTSRSKYNFHLVKPLGKYRAESEQQIAAAGCRTRKDNIRMVEALFTASPEFFKGKKRAEIRLFFEEALHFLEQHQAKETIISAVVHMDEKTPHMHLCFVPLTGDGRLSAKNIMGNKKKLTWWQDEFWNHMVKRFPDLERGESASQTGRDHIPPRVFKEMTRLTKQKDKLEDLLTGINPFNAKSRAEEICKILDTYIPSVEKMDTLLRKYGVAFTKTASENKKLKTKNAELEESLASVQKVSTLKQIEDFKLRRDYDSAVAILEQIPPEVLELYKQPHKKERETAYDR